MIHAGAVARDGEAVLVAARSGSGKSPLIAYLVARGFEFLAVFQNEIVYDQGPDSGSVQSLAQSEIKSLKDLIGKRVATAQLNGQQTIAAQFAMRKAGIDPAKIAAGPSSSRPALISTPVDEDSCAPALRSVD